jgi:hypothetical protein
MNRIKLVSVLGTLTFLVGVGLNYEKFFKNVFGYSSVKIVLTHNGKPIDNTEIVLSDTTEDNTYQHRSDHTGTINFPSVKEGDYVYSFSFQDSLYKFRLNVSDGDRTDSPKFSSKRDTNFLRKPNIATPRSLQDSVSKSIKQFLRRRTFFN